MNTELTAWSLDLSTTATGICDRHGKTHTFRPPTKKSMLRRCQLTRDAIGACRGGDVTVIEAIGTRFINTAIGMGTLHGLVLDMLSESQTDIYMVPPTQLKKWATGKGAGAGTDKVGMSLKAAAAGWEPTDTASDDEADAWWLWTIGQAIIGNPVVPVTKTRGDLLAAITATNADLNG